MSRSSRVQKIKLFKKIYKGRPPCHLCLKYNSGKNQFTRARRGTC